MSSFPSSFFNPRTLRGRLVLSLTGIIAIYASMYFLDANYLLDALLEIRGMNFTSLYSAAALLPLVGGLAASVGPFAMKMFNMNFGFKRKKADALTKNNGNNNVQEVSSAAPQAISLAASNGAAIASSSRLAQEKTQSAKNPAAATTAATSIFRQSAAGNGNGTEAPSNGAATTTTATVASAPIPAGIAATANIANPGSDDDNNNNNSDAVTSQDSERILEEVENKIKPAVEEVGVIKQDVVTLKEDMSTIRTSIESLSSTLETSLVDLKAFQAEMVNPINFMRKYFDSMDIKALSDPSAPFVGMQKHESPRQEAPPPPQQQPVVEATTKKGIINKNHKDDDDGDADDDGSSSIADADHTLVQEYQKEEDNDAMKLKEILAPRRMLPVKKKTGLISRSSVSHDDTLAIKGMLESGITPGKIMSIVSVVDEILTTMGPDGVDLLVEQYKRLGLTEEDELVIYTILRLLNESKIYTEEIIAMLYRFGQVLGINDKDAELQYTRLIANKARRRTPRKPEADG